MKKLNDYQWLCNEWKIKDYIINNRTWKEISNRPLLNGFLTQLIGVELLKHPTPITKINSPYD